MKKWIALLLLLMMSTACLAESLPEIQFRGFSFGTTIAQIKAETNEYVDAESSPWWSTDMDELSKGSIFTIKEDKTADAVLLEMLENVTEVAGYSCGMAIRYFVRPVIDGSLDMEDDHAQLYAGCYEIYASSCAEVPAAIKDLTEKLSQLYGKPVVDEKYVKRGKTKELQESTTTWKGANDTEIILHGRGNTNAMHLTYAWRGAQPMIDAARACVKTEVVDNSNNFSGL